MPLGQGLSVFKEGPTRSSCGKYRQRPGGLQLDIWGGAGAGLTIRMQACFPSMKPLGMAFAARIS